MKDLKVILAFAGVIAVTYAAFEFADEQKKMTGNATDTSTDEANSNASGMSTATRTAAHTPLKPFGDWFNALRDAFRIKGDHRGQH